MIENIILDCGFGGGNRKAAFPFRVQLPYATSSVRIGFRDP
jgi:hypothetical protein